MEHINPEQLFEENRDKTRVLILSSDKKITQLILHAVKSGSRKMDFISNEGQSETHDSDFIIFEKNNFVDAEKFHPNIVFLAENYPISVLMPLFKNITGGGILVYKGSDEQVSQALNSTENYFRQIPYSDSVVENGLLKTEFGDIPLSFSDQQTISNIDGARLLCQQLGIMEEEFYEALMNYEENC